MMIFTQNTKTIIIALCVAVFVLAFGSGMFFQFQKNAQAMQKYAKVSSLLENMSSELVPSIVAYGQVKSFGQNSVVLGLRSNRLEISIDPNISVTSFTPLSGKLNQGAQTPANYGDIKIGDYVNAGLKISPEGVLTAQTIVLFKNN